MKTTLSGILALLLLAAVVSGETYVQGNIGNAVWTLAGSPYIVTGNVSAYTLIIEAGVHVQFNSNSYISISSLLTVNGTNTDSVYFSTGTSTWGYIKTSTSQIQYSVIEGGGNYFSYPALSLQSGTISIKNCTFRDNQRAIGPYSGATYPTDVKILNCDFYSNHPQNTSAHIVNFTIYGSLIVEGCRFFDNTSNGLISTYRNTTVDGTTVISRCQFFNNTSNFAVRAEYGTISNSVFYQAITTGHPVLLGVNLTEPYYVQNCIFWDCDSITSDPQQYLIEYSDLATPYPGIGNINLDPLFVDPDNGNFNLNPGSPCIDTGNPAGWWYEPDHSRADMGCYGGGGFVPFPLNLEFPPLWPAEIDTLPFYFYNLTNLSMQIQSVFFTSPLNFSYQSVTGSPIPAYGRAKYNIIVTYPGYERSSQFVINSPQFYTHFDTASVSVHATSETFTPVSGVWTLENSPYNITQNLVVPDGQQLIIEAGVHVDFATGITFKVEGNLQALGTSTGLIYLYHGGSEYWDGVWFDSADGNNILDHVRLEDAGGSPATLGKGGSIHANNTQLSINGSTFDDCAYYPEWSFSNYGGAIYAQNCPTISVRNSTFQDCKAPIDGGALYLKNCPQVTLDSCQFKYNEAEQRGGAIYADSSTCVFDSCWFDHNKVNYYIYGLTGSALYSNYSTVNFSRTILSENWAENNGSEDVISLNSQSHLTMDHSDIYNQNQLTGQQASIEITDHASNAIVSNSIFYHQPNLFLPPNTPNIQMIYSIAQQTWPGIGNLVGDPCLSQEFELAANSPCIDTGDPNFIIDPDSTRSDMGALYYDQNGPGGPIIGPVFGVWTPDHGPYDVAGDINVPAGDTLRMLPGTIVLFNSNWDFDVYGTLIMVGTSEDSITLIPNDYSSVYLIYHSTQNQSQLEYGHLIKITLFLGPQPTIIRHSSTYGGYINGDNSSGNVLEDSYLDQMIDGGTNWLIQRNVIYRYVVLNNEVFPAVAEGIIDASGIFMDNMITVQASNSYGSAYASGFSNCSGEIAHNVIYASASGSDYSSVGIGYSAATIHHNSIQAGTICIKECPGTIYNNTLINADYGITSYVPHNPVKNNIVYNCDFGFRGAFDVQYSCAYNCPTPFSQGATQGIGTILQDPQMVNFWYLSPTSPCIDAGDPAHVYNDSDGTRNDMGANYYAQVLSGMYVNVCPVAPPVIIPANGGSFQYYMHVLNPTTAPQTFQIWNKVRDAHNQYAMVFGPVTRTLPASANPTRTLTQYIAGYISSGTLTFISYIGAYPNTIADSSCFTITKSETSDGGPWIAESYVTGDLFEELTSAKKVIPKEYSLQQNYPNPFNPKTAISYQLSAISFVNLSVYDISGRKVAELVNGRRDAGIHQLTFDGSGLASGIYLYKLEAGGFTVTNKMVLMK